MRNSFLTIQIKRDDARLWTLLKCPESEDVMFDHKQKVTRILVLAFLFLRLNPSNFEPTSQPAR